MERRLTCLLACLSASLGLAAPAGAVVGGHPASPGTFPYVANVFIAGSFGCTGTLIAPDWVVTAGHCGSLTGSLTEGVLPTPVSYPLSQYQVRLGSVYADGRGGENHAVSQAVVDSGYVVTNGSGNDVTLLQLTVPSRVTPMHIAPELPQLWRAGVLATIAGFGTTSETATSSPDRMQYAQVPIQSDAACAQAYPSGLGGGSFDPSTEICAGYPQGGTDTCQGDSGGPLLVPVGGQPLLAGATSFGNGCAKPGHPGVYALLSAGPIRSFIARFVPRAFASASPGSGSPTSPPNSPRRHRAAKHHRRHHATKHHRHHHPTKHHRHHAKHPRTRS